jgi:hypothetical protein
LKDYDRGLRSREAWRMANLNNLALKIRKKYKEFLERKIDPEISV